MTAILGQLSLIASDYEDKPIHRLRERLTFRLKGGLGNAT